MSKRKEIIKDERSLQIDEADKLTGKSAKIRYLDSAGWSRKEIAVHLGIRYQHVRNVLVTILKKDMK